MFSLRLMYRRISLWMFWGTFVIVLMLAASPAMCTTNPGTTANIKEIFLGRCYDYRQVKYRTLLPLTQVSDNCTSLWDKFFKAFSFMSPCAVSMTDYDPFVQAAQQQIPENKTLFWSGVKGLVSEYSARGKLYVTLEDTLIGYLLDGLVWCGQSSPPGVDYSRCPSRTDCPEASRAFWTSASKPFASSARGEVVVMLNGSRADRPAYSRTSIFGKYELPSLNPSAVTRVLVLLTHSLDGPTHETCFNGSLALLEQDVLARGFQFHCEDDPAAIRHLLYADNPSDGECRLAPRYSGRDACGSVANPASSTSGSSPAVVRTKPTDRWMDVATALSLLSVHVVRSVFD